MNAGRRPMHPLNVNKRLAGDCFSDRSGTFTNFGIHWQDIIFIERLRRSMKCWYIRLNFFKTGLRAEAGNSWWIACLKGSWQAPRGPVEVSPVGARSDFC